MHLQDPSTNSFPPLSMAPALVLRCYAPSYSTIMLSVVTPPFFRFRQLRNLDRLEVNENPKLSGSMKEICKGSLVFAEADCDKVSCPCCPEGSSCPSYFWGEQLLCILSHCHVCNGTHGEMTEFSCFGSPQIISVGLVTSVSISSTISGQNSKASHQATRKDSSKSMWTFIQCFRTTLAITTFFATKTFVHFSLIHQIIGILRSLLTSTIIFLRKIFLSSATITRSVISRIYR